MHNAHEFIIKFIWIYTESWNRLKIRKVFEFVSKQKKRMPSKLPINSFQCKILTRIRFRYKNKKCGKNFSKTKNLREFLSKLKCNSKQKMQAIRFNACESSPSKNASEFTWIGDALVQQCRLHFLRLVVTHRAQRVPIPCAGPRPIDAYGYRTIMFFGRARVLRKRPLQSQWRCGHTIWGWIFLKHTV